MRSTDEGLLGRLEGAIDELLGADLADADLTDHQRRVRESINRLEYEFLRGITALRTREGVRPAAAIAWMTSELKLSRGAAGQRLAMAGELAAHPRTAALLSAGAVSYEQAAIVTESTAAVAPEDANRVEERLLGSMDLGLGRLRGIAGAVVAEVDGEALLRSQGRRAWERRGLAIGPDIGGSAPVSGFLTSEAAARWRNALEPYMRPVADDTRTKAQRMHDAMVTVLRGAGSPDGGTGRNGRRPQLVITAPLSTMLGEAGPPALLKGIIPISREELDRCVCEADLTLLLRDARGNIAFQARRARSFSPAKRRGILALNPMCAWVPCELPARECDLHHLDEFNRGGETTSDLGAPLCGAHHDKIHKEGWALVVRADGSLEPVPPNHPDNPRAGLPPAEYIRRRLRAMTERALTRGGRTAVHRRRRGFAPAGEVAVPTAGGPRAPD